MSLFHWGLSFLALAILIGIFSVTKASGWKVILARWLCGFFLLLAGLLFILVMFGIRMIA